MKHTLIPLIAPLSVIFHFSLFLLPSSAAVPLKWTVDTSRVQPATFDAYQGETLTFEAALQSYGKPLAAPSEYAIYWQTNGMGSAWWVRPCTVPDVSRVAGAGTNVLYATFSPDMDVGAKAYSCFIGLSNSIYRAAFQLRLRPSPGAVPNLIEQPPRVLDLAHTVVVNPPWPTDATISSSIRQGIDESFDGGTNAVNAAIERVTNTYTKDETDAAIETNNLGLVKLSDWNYPNAEWTPVKMRDQRDEYDGVRLWFSCMSLAWPWLDWYFDAMDVEYGEGLTVASRGWVNHFKADKAELEATMAEAGEAKAAANNANFWSMATYNFMTGGRTNCWFSGTNYVFGAEAATRTRFAWEGGMDAATVPCSMALWEIRDGDRQLVWDQRDWTAWYWSFKSAQMAADIQGRIDALGNAVTNASNYAWAKRYASDGTPNPDASTTFIDTPSVTLSPGMKWETVATVSGAAYWTIVGNGAVIGGSGTNATLRIQDFEGNDIMTVTKGEHRLAWLERGEITGQMIDADGWICFDMLADAEPVGYFSTTLDSSDFLPQTDPNCPAQYSWEAIGGGKWRVHFLLKPGIQAKSCFAKFQVEVEGQTVIRYNAGQEISGGLIYNGVKIAPDVSGSPSVGTVIQWKVVH